MPDVVAGRYELLDPVAAGTSGSVWTVRDLRTGRLAAAKVMRRRDAADLLRFTREAQARFDHPHIVAPRAWAGEDEHVLLAMDLVCGGTVADVLSRRGRLDRDSAARLLDQLLGALAAVHAAGWIHRDVKPANLLLEATGTGPVRMRLGDFGIALRTDHPRLTATGMLNGTPGYQPPEIVAGGAPSAAQDLYAAGVVALGCLARPEPRGDDPWEPGAIDHLLGRAGVAARDPLAGLVRRLLAVDPAQRPASAAAARAVLRPAVTPGPLRAADGSIVELVDRVRREPADRPRPPRRAPAGHAAGVVLVAALVAGLLGVGAWARHPAPGDACADPGAVAVSAQDDYLVCRGDRAERTWQGAG